MTNWMALLLVGWPAGDATNSAQAKPATKAPAPRITFDRDVFPILAEKCLSCHDAEGGLAESRLDLATVKSLLAGGKRGPAIVPNKGDESLLYRTAAKLQKPHMPPKNEDPLTPQELAKLKAWIDAGAPAGTNLFPAKSLEKQVELQDLPPTVAAVEALAIDPAGRWLAAGRGNHVDVYDLGNLQWRQRLRVGQDVVQALRFSDDGRVLAAGGYREVTLWKLAQATEAPAEPWVDLDVLMPLAGRVVSLAFSPDGRFLATGGGLPAATGELLLWDLVTREPIRVFADVHSDTVLGLAFDPSGKLIASASADKFVKVNEIETRKLTRSFEGHTDHVLGVAWSPDGKTLASASADKTVKLWNYETGEPIRSIGGHGRAVTGIAWLPKTSQVLTSSGDRNVRLIETSNGEHRRGYGGATDFLNAVAVTRDGAKVAAGSHDGKVFVWQVADGKLLATLAPPAKTP